MVFTYSSRVIDGHEPSPQHEKEPTDGNQEQPEEAQPHNTQVSEVIIEIILG